MQVALPFLHEHELPEAVRFEMQQEEEAQKASGVTISVELIHASASGEPLLSVSGLCCALLYRQWRWLA